MQLHDDLICHNVIEIKLVTIHAIRSTIPVYIIIM